MSGANHVAGGIVYTGIFCSFWNVNIFSYPWFLACTLIFALLPDIDHTKSPLGRLFSFTRLPQYLDRNFGHRTITHSLLIYLTTGFVVYFIESYFSEDHPFTLIYFLAYSSHLVFDMMTVSGVPLFFPFKKNPCVIPGNPDYRLKVKDLKSESLVFALFLGIMLFCYPLMEQGFWTTYNRQFGTLDHLNREYIGSSDLLKVEYNYMNKGKQYKGFAHLVHSEKSKAFLFSDGNLFEVNDKMKIERIVPAHTAEPRVEQEIYFYNISIDSLNSIIKERIILAADFQCSDKVRYFSSSGYKETNIIKLDYSFNPDLEILQDTLNVRVLKQLEIKNIELKDKINSNLQEKNKYKAILAEIQLINQTYDQLGLAEKESAVKRLAALNLKKDNFQFSNASTEKLQKQIEQLQQEIDQAKTPTFTGKISILDL